MKKFADYIGNATYPVIDFRRKPRYVNSKPTEILDSCYTILHSYDQIDITVADDGNVVTQEQIKNAADAGTPIVMEFTDLEVIIQPKEKWEIKASGRASRAILSKSK